MRRTLPVVVALIVVVSACGGGPTAPTAPPIAQGAGVWRGTQTLTGASGGDCLGAAFAASIGFRSDVTVSVTQNGANISGTSTSPSTGLSCRFSGTAGERTVTMNTTSCDANTFTRLQCLNGTLRDATLVASSSTGTLIGSTISGTSGESYNTFSSLNGASAGVMTLQSSFSITRQ
jgi:hypothetical protein